MTQSELDGPTCRRRGAKKRGVCRVPGCTCELSTSYCWQRNICPKHLKAECVLIQEVSGSLAPGAYRFCFQCAKLHPLAAFQGTKRSCKAGLLKRQQHTYGEEAGHYRKKGNLKGAAATPPANNTAGRDCCRPTKAEDEPTAATAAAATQAVAVVPACAEDDEPSPFATQQLLMPNLQSTETAASAAAEATAALLAEAWASSNDMDTEGQEHESSEEELAQWEEQLLLPPLQQQDSLLQQALGMDWTDSNLPLVTCESEAAAAAAAGTMAPAAQPGQAATAAGAPAAAQWPGERTLGSSGQPGLSGPAAAWPASPCLYSCEPGCFQEAGSLTETLSGPFSAPSRLQVAQQQQQQLQCQLGADCCLSSRVCSTRVTDDLPADILATQHSRTSVASMPGVATLAVPPAAPAAPAAAPLAVATAAVPAPGELTDVQLELLLEEELRAAAHSVWEQERCRQQQLREKRERIAELLLQRQCMQRHQQKLMDSARLGSLPEGVMCQLAGPAVQAVLPAVAPAGPWIPGVVMNAAYGQPSCGVTTAAVHADQAAGPTMSVKNTMKRLMWLQQQFSAVEHMLSEANQLAGKLLRHNSR